jgi:glycosyltransferase involved in cell wall biosynthesis
MTSAPDHLQLRIAMLLPNLQVGGSQEVVCSLARALTADDCQPIACALFEGGPLEADLRDQGTPVEVLHLQRRPLRALPWCVADCCRMWLRLRQFLKANRINVIQTNNLGSQDYLTLAVAKTLGVPVVTFNFHSERIFPPERERSTLAAIRSWLYRRCRRWASDYVAVSPGTKDSMLQRLKLKSDQVTVICNGVDTERFSQADNRCRVRARLGLPESAQLLTTVGTLKPVKGHEHLIAAAGRVREHYDDVHFLLVGDGPLRPELEAQVAAAKLADRIHFLGSRRDVGELLAASDAFVLPSLWEGLSMALLEAMAAGKPVVATRVSGTSSVLEGTGGGLLVPPGDANALAEAILSLLARSPQERRAMGEAARRQVVANFSVHKQAEEYRQLYRRLLAAGRERVNSASQPQQVASS